MRLAAVYIYEHEYLFNEPQIINFGGEYLYDFELIGRNLYVTRSQNLQFIPDFFNTTNSETKIEWVSAIVGENGIGKSSILDCLRGMFIKHQYALPDGNITAILEINGEIKVLDSRFEVHLKEDEKYTRLESVEKDDVQTLYYSPHVDLKYNFNFSDFDLYNISVDVSLEKDLEDLDKKDTNENGWKYHPVEELVFKNSMRQISFLSSSIYSENNVFRELFNVPKYEKGILFFREYTIDEEYWNVPREFKYFFKDLFNKIEEENKLWHTLRKFDDKHNVLNQAEIWCFLLERKIISSFCSTIIEQMNKQNTFLQEGFFKVDNVKEFTKDMNSIDLFKFFLEYSFINKRDEFKVFNHENAFKLIDFIFEKIRNVKDEHEISKSKVNLSFEEISVILELHRIVLFDLFNYYPTSENVIEESSYIDGFISFRPTDKFLSSGENALLNFYSRLHNFIQTFLVEESKFREDKRLYLILLDEADLGYHPTWKKKFIYALVNTLPYFFENLKVIPNLQIIFSTHDPLTLSDVPNNSVVYLKKEGEFSKILNKEDVDRPQKTFGANIHELLADSFFVEDGLIGEFAKNKIEETIRWINENKSNKQIDKVKLAYYKSVIELIDEKIVRLKLAEMLSEIEGNNDFQKSVYNKEIAFLMKQRDKLN